MKRLTILALAAFSSAALSAAPSERLASARLCSIKEISIAFERVGKMAEQPQYGMIASGGVQMQMLTQLPEVRLDAPFAFAVFGDSNAIAARLANVDLEQLDKAMEEIVENNELAPAIAVPCTSLPAVMKSEAVVSEFAEIPGFGTFAIVAPDATTLDQMKACAAGILSSGSGTVLSAKIDRPGMRAVDAFSKKIYQGARKVSFKSMEDEEDSNAKAFAQKLVGIYYEFMSAMSNMGDIEAFDFSASVAADGVYLEYASVYRPGSVCDAITRQPGLPDAIAEIESAPAGSSLASVDTATLSPVVKSRYSAIAKKLFTTLLDALDEEVASKGSDIPDEFEPDVVKLLSIARAYLNDDSTVSKGTCSFYAGVKPGNRCWLSFSIGMTNAEGYLAKYAAPAFAACANMINAKHKGAATVAEEAGGRVALDIDFSKLPVCTSSGKDDAAEILYMIAGKGLTFVETARNGRIECTFAGTGEAVPAPDAGIAAALKAAFPSYGGTPIMAGKLSIAGFVRPFLVKSAKEQPSAAEEPLASMIAGSESARADGILYLETAEPGAIRGGIKFTGSEIASCIKIFQLGELLSQIRMQKMLDEINKQEEIYIETGDKPAPEGIKDLD